MIECIRNKEAGILYLMLQDCGVDEKYFEILLDECINSQFLPGLSHLFSLQQIDFSYFAKKRHVYFNNEFFISVFLNIQMNEKYYKFIYNSLSDLSKRRVAVLKSN
jgi:hypothetical protein